MLHWIRDIRLCVDERAATNPPISVRASILLATHKHTHTLTDNLHFQRLSFRVHFPHESNKCVECIRIEISTVGFDSGIELFVNASRSINVSLNLRNFMNYQRKTNICQTFSLTHTHTRTHTQPYTRCFRAGWFVWAGGGFFESVKYRLNC